MLEHGDGIQKGPLIWVHALMCLVLLFHFSAPERQWQFTSHAGRIRQKLRAFNVHPDTLHFSSFEKANTVYCLFQMDIKKALQSSSGLYSHKSSLLYIGSTAKGVNARHLNRMAVYRRLFKTQLVDAELAVRYWHSQKNLFDFCVVPLCQCSTYKEAWGVEHELIAQWQSQLNYPHALKFLKKTALGYRPAKRKRSAAYSQFGLRLWRKLRKRLFPCKRLFALVDNRKKAWDLVFDLSSHTKAAFEADKFLRSRFVADAEVYAIIRLSRNIEEPHRTKVTNALKRVVNFRTNMHWPRQSKALSTLPLAHPEYETLLKSWLRKFILDFKYLFPPLHVPKASIREAPHQSIKKFLHNFQVWEDLMWAPDFKPEQLPCHCSWYGARLPSDCFVDQHLACGLESLCELFPEFGPIAFASAASTFFPAQHQWFQRSLDFFKQWRQHHRLPVTVEPMFEVFLKDAWPRHLECLKNSRRLTWRDVQVVKARLHDHLVLYNEDHHPNHIVCFCPRFFVAGLQHTWDDESVFQRLPGHPDEWKQRVVNAIPSWMLRRYPWAFNKQADLPKGTVFLKAKKAFRKGRTIISYSQSLCCKLLEFAAIAINLMVKTLYPEAPGLASMPVIWKQLHTFFNCPDTTVFEEWNDDLVGFFNAVPRQDILEAVSDLVKNFQAQTGHDSVSVSVSGKTGHSGQPRGGLKSPYKVCRVQDIPAIVRVSFETGVFTAAGSCRKQKEGTCIGNQISPVLSGLPVLMAEQRFLQTLPSTLASSFLFLRYVDNRLLLAPQSVLQSPQIQQFCASNFYRGIQLETVRDHKWLGFTIDAAARTASFVMPEKPWQIRSPYSAGSWRLCASGYFSRAALIHQYAWPREHISTQLRELKQLYKTAGFPESSLRR